MAEKTGYNLVKIKELMGNIEECYTNLASVITTAWEPVSQTLRKEWVGEDEQSYEDMVVKRINEMYVETHTMAQSSVDVIYNLADLWYKFQQNNKLEGATDVGNSTFGLEQLTLTKNEQLITFTTTQITDDMDRGLANASSAYTIQLAFEAFKRTIQSKIQEMIDAVDVSQAFFGEQTTNIKAYVNKVGSAMGELVTAIKHLYDKITELTDTQYGSASTTYAQDIDNVSSSVENNLSNLGESRWNS